MTPPTETVRSAHASERQARRPSASRSNGPGSAVSSRNASPKRTSRSAARGGARERRAPRAATSEEPHAARRRSACRRAAQAASGREPVLAADDDRVEAQVAERSQCPVEPPLVLEGELAHLAAREPRRRDRSCRRIGERNDDAAHVGEALLPGRILDDDRHDVPAEGAQPGPVRRPNRRQVVGEDEDEAARREGVTVAEQRLEPELERARRRRERRFVEPGADVREAARACRREPERAPVRRRVIEIRHLAERVDGARRDRLGRRAHRRRLVEPGRLRSEEPERRSPVDEDRRPGRFLREVFTDDELVGPAGGREPGGGGPVDPRDVVTGPVGPRADDLVALAAAQAATPAERDADETPARDERKGSHLRH